MKTPLKKNNIGVWGRLKVDESIKLPEGYQAYQGGHGNITPPPYTLSCAYSSTWMFLVHTFYNDQKPFLSSVNY